MKAEGIFRAFTQEDLENYGSPRTGELRLWERVQLPGDPEKPLELAPSHPASFVLVGIPEDIGPRANLGRGGADKAWDAFLGKFLNIQENRFGIADRVLLGGEVVTGDLFERAEGLSPSDEEELSELRKLTAELDERVVQVVRAIVEAGKCPILIGGGHNNAYGNLRGSCEALRRKGALAPDEGIACLNMDPHADLRRAEGRHSGNGFSYAMDEGFLGHYAMLGLHKNYNPESILQRFDESPERFLVRYFEDILSEREREQVFREALEFLQEERRPFGLEIDLDCIAGMAVSAETPSGFHENDVRLFLKRVVTERRPAYIHLAEGAPENRPGYTDHVGKSLAYLASDAIRESIDPV